MEIPATLDMAEQALDLLLAEEREVMSLIKEFHETRSELDDIVTALYQVRASTAVEMARR